MIRSGANHRGAERRHEHSFWAANQWLPDAELRVYSGEFGRTGFQGALQWYRCLTGQEFVADIQDRVEPIRWVADLLRGEDMT